MPHRLSSPRVEGLHSQINHVLYCEPHFGRSCTAEMAAFLQVCMKAVASGTPDSSKNLEIDQRALQCCCASQRIFFSPYLAKNCFDMQGSASLDVLGNAVAGRRANHCTPKAPRDSIVAWHPVVPATRPGKRAPGLGPMRISTALWNVKSLRRDMATTRRVRQKCVGLGKGQRFELLACAAHGEP